MDVRLDDIRALLETIDNTELKTPILDRLNDIEAAMAQANNDRAAIDKRNTELQAINASLLSRVTVQQTAPQPSTAMDMEAITESFVFRPVGPENS